MNRLKIFCEGLVTAALAHTSAWVILVSVDKILHLCGHIAVALLVQVLDSAKR